MHAINGKIRKSKEQYYMYIVTSSVLKREKKIDGETACHSGYQPRGSAGFAATKLSSFNKK